MKPHAIFGSLLALCLVCNVAAPARAMTSWTVEVRFLLNPADLPSYFIAKTAQFTRHVACELSSDPDTPKAWPIAIKNRIGFGTGNAMPLISPNYGTDFNQVAVTLKLTAPLDVIPPTSVLVCRGSIIANGTDVTLHSSTFADVMTDRVGNINTQGPPSLVTALDQAKLSALLGPGAIPPAVKPGAAVSAGASAVKLKSMATGDGKCRMMVPESWESSTWKTGDYASAWPQGRGSVSLMRVQPSFFAAWKSGASIPKLNTSTTVLHSDPQLFVRETLYTHNPDPTTASDNQAVFMGGSVIGQTACLGYYVVYDWLHVGASMYPPAKVLETVRVVSPK